MLAVLGMTFTSCEKCTTCSCTNETTWEFENGFDATVEDAIVTAYEKEIDEDYGEIAPTELCATRGDFDGEVAAFEGQSHIISEGDNVQGYDWSLDFSRSCTCEE